MIRVWRKHGKSDFGRLNIHRQITFRTDRITIQTRERGSDFFLFCFNYISCNTSMRQIAATNKTFRNQMFLNNMMAFGGEKCPKHFFILTHSCFPWNQVLKMKDEDSVQLITMKKNTTKETMIVVNIQFFPSSWVIFFLSSTVEFSFSQSDSVI